MSETLERIVVACSCEGTMPLDTAAIAKGCGGTLRTADHLCRRQLDLAKSLIGTGAPITIGCTQESALFSEVAQELGAEGNILFTNIREQAGWSKDAAAAGPKMAALLAAAAEPTPAIQLFPLKSEGVALVYGRDEAAIEAGRRLADKLDITVLLTRPGEVVPPRTTGFPVLKGTITGAKGHLGAFDLRVDDYAIPAPSSRQKLVFGEPRNGATSTCDIVLDLSGGMPLFPAHELRSGYLRADPRDPAAVERAIAEAGDLVASSTSRASSSSPRISAPTPATRSPAAPAASISAPPAPLRPGRGSCGHRPGGLRRLRSLRLRLPDGRGLLCPPARGRAHPQASHAPCRLPPGRRRQPSGPLPRRGARGAAHRRACPFRDGLPANVLPVRLNEVTQIGPETIASAFAYGAVGVRLLARARPKHDLSGLHRVLATAPRSSTGLGYGWGVAGLIETDDPDELVPALMRAPSRHAPPDAGLLRRPGAEARRPRTRFPGVAAGRPPPIPVVALAAGAPFGGLDHNAEGCTLCLACVSACPTHALTDNPERPMLRFTESLCVQCGLCAATCPEDVIALKPQLDFAAWDSPRRVLKEEEPFHCISCAKPFGTKSTVERVMAKLGDRHWMFSGHAGQERLRILQMCEDCRVEAVVNESFDPHGGPAPAEAADGRGLFPRARRRFVLTLPLGPFSGQSGQRPFFQHGSRDNRLPGKHELSRDETGGAQ
jgi:ferredoxin